MSTNGERPISTLHQGPRKRAARRVQVCPESEEQRRKWEEAAGRAGMSLSAWLTYAAEHKRAHRKDLIPVEAGTWQEELADEIALYLELWATRSLAKHTNDGVVSWQKEAGMVAVKILAMVQEAMVGR